MASIRISQLPQYTDQIISVEKIPLVISGNVATNYVETKNLFGNTNITPTSLNDVNAMSFVAASNNSAVSFTDTGNLAGGRAFIASNGGSINGAWRSGYIGTDGGNISGAGGDWIIASANSNIYGGYYNTIISSENPNILAGAWNSIIASYGGSEIQGGDTNFIAASQGFVLGSNSNKCAGVGVEAGGWNGPRFSFAGGGYNLTTTNDGGNDHFAGAYNGLTFDGTAKGGYLYKVAGIAVQDGTVSNDISALIASSGRTTLYDQTLHTDNTYVWGHETHPNTITTTIANVQYFNANLGMVQYCDVAAGNLNLDFQNVRNGEMYRWVINNTSGGVINLNSVAVPVGFTYVDDTASGNYGTGFHTFYITVINDYVVVGHYK